MEPVRNLAIMCIGRAVLFGALAIFCIMFAFAFDPAAAFRSGAIMTLMMTGILLLKARYATIQKPRNTEVWIYLDPRSRPRDEEATRRYLSVLREVYARFAFAGLLAACAMFAVSLLFSFAGGALAELTIFPAAPT